MPDKSVYISYRPAESLHIAQPLFNGLRKAGYDVFMDIEDGVDAINLHQIVAREHFIMILTPGALGSVGKAEDRLATEFYEAVKHKRNMVLLVAKDFDFTTEMTGVTGLMEHLPRVPTLRLQPKQFNEVLRQLQETILIKSAALPLVPTPTDEVEQVAEKIKTVRSYTEQQTIHLNTEKMFFVAVQKIRRGEFESALADLNLVIAENPNNENAYLQRGRVLRKQGRKSAALRDYDYAIRLSPKLVSAHIGRGELLLELGKSHEAELAFQDALALQADSSPALAGLALAKSVQHQTEQALALWNRLLERDPNYADPQWTGEGFEWDKFLVAMARELTSKL
ncbi:MAG: tetratricopeptide repeat protein [Phototrophicaceae bacterium]|jgi:tetratricopeptide (TPR) repeat protein